MVAVVSPYSVLPKNFAQAFGDASPCLAPWWCLARAAVRTGESSDDLKSRLLERLTFSSTGWVHLCDRLAFALRNSAALTSTSYSTVALHYPCGPARPWTRRFCASSVPAHRLTLRFSRDILVPTVGVCESCSLSGTLPSSGSCARRPEQPQVYRSNSFCASPSRSVTWRANPLPRAQAFTQKAVGPPPLPGRWPSDPYRPVTGLRKCPLRSCPAGCASLNEVSNHRWTFAALLRVTAQGSNNLG